MPAFEVKDKNRHPDVPPWLIIEKPDIGDDYPPYMWGLAGIWLPEILLGSTMRETDLDRDRRLGVLRARMATHEEIAEACLLL